MDDSLLHFFFHCLIIVSIYNYVYIRDVNLQLFGGIPLLFFAFRFFRNHFPLFLEKSLTKKKKKKEAGVRRRHCQESSKSFGTRLLAFPVLSQCGISTRHLKSDTCNHAPPASRKGKGRVVVRWRDGVGREGGGGWRGRARNDRH